MPDLNHRLSEPSDEGEEERRRCEADLDQLPLYPSDDKINAFLTRWGEPLRELLNNIDHFIKHKDNYHGHYR